VKGVALIGAGTVLAGRYRIDERIAGGGMGEVWRGFDQVLSRTVAVKCLRAPSDELAFVERFRDEARMMATISHPGVVEVYDFGDDPVAGVYLVMKYIEGESLAHKLARDGRLSPQATMRLVAEAAEALQAAHDKGVTHRDVKPGNLLLRADGSAVLTDFGIAHSSGATRHTLTGSLIGTAAYIAPERANGQPATIRSDIYSLGVVAYQCLAGDLPFTGDSVVQIALRHAHDEAPPLPPDVPQRVRAVVEQAMGKDPASRWPSGAALATAARRASAGVPAQRTASGSTQGTAVDSAGRRSALSGRALLVAGVAALLVAVVSTVGILLSRDRDPQTRNPAANPSVSRPAAFAGTASPSPSQGSAGPSASAGAVPLSVPSNLTATPIGPNTIRLQWTDNSTDEDGFTIHNGITSNDVGANTTTFEWTGLLPGTHTCFKVRAYNSSGVSSYYPTAEPDWVCATSLDGSGPPAPTDLTATPVGPTAIRLQWTDTSTSEEGFTIHNGVTFINVGANTLTYEWDGLAPNTYMCFRVRSYNMAGVSAFAPSGEPGWACTTTPTT
jgi:serine/threonine-protein kinase